MSNRVSTPIQDCFFHKTAIQFLCFPLIFRGFAAVRHRGHPRAGPGYPIMPGSWKKWLPFLLLATAVLAAGCARPRRPRNLVVIVSDALRRDILGCYGGPARTPYIDELAREGTVFDQAYSTSPTTMPSAVSMLTGCHARTFTFDHRMVFLDYLDKKVPSAFFRVGDGVRMLAEVMAETGFDPRASIENGLVRACNLLQGFSLLPRGGDLSLERKRKIEEELGFHGENLSERAMYGTLDFLLHADREKPFFLFKWIFDPHSPYDPPPRFRAGVDAAAGDLPRPGPFYSDFRNPDLRAKLDNSRMNRVEREYIAALYRAEAESVDQRVGAILKALEANGSRRETLVIFTADHGECLGDYGMYGHGRAVHPPLIRVPLIFSGPGIPRGRRIPSVISHLDLTPTLAEIFKVQGISPMQGRSYAGVFRGEKLRDRDVYFGYFSNVLAEWTGVDAYLGGGCLLIVDRRQGRPQFRLYDRNLEPERNVDMSSSRPGTVNRLFKQIQEIRKKNRELVREHARLLRENLDSAAEIEKTRRLLESLGYL